MQNFLNYLTIWWKSRCKTLLKCRRPTIEVGVQSLTIWARQSLHSVSYSVRLKVSVSSMKISVPLKSSPLRRCCLVSMQSPTRICSQTCPAYMGAMSAVLARLLVLARPVQNMPKCRHPAECRRCWHFGPFSENFSPAFRGRLLGSYHSDQRAVKSKNAPFGLLFQISPLGTLWACPERLHVNKKAGQPPFPRPKKSISAPRGPTIPLQVCICSQKLSESSSITFKSPNRGLLAF